MRGYAQRDLVGLMTAMAHDKIHHIMARTTRLGLTPMEQRGMLVLLAASFFVLAIFGVPQVDRGQGSVEVAFSDPSPVGMAIVPASCPSSPHSSGECSSCTVGYFCSGSDRYYRNASCATSFIERCQHGCANGLCLDAELTGDSGSCTPQYFCFGADLYYRSSQCADSFIQTCFYGCTAGSCNVAPAGTLNIQVSPALVRTGNPTTVSWTSSGMASCTVAEDNPGINDVWSGTSGTQQSGIITQRTTYTLTCRDEENEVYTDTATVNILFVFEET